MLAMKKEEGSCVNEEEGGSCVNVVEEDSCVTVVEMITMKRKKIAV